MLQIYIRRQQNYLLSSNEENSCDLDSVGSLRSRQCSLAGETVQNILLYRNIYCFQLVAII